ncbi:Uncharacterised protein [uncultured archaeon]|nr:Uncharacterised protein [uncultured archaeon]
MLDSPNAIRIYYAKINFEIAKAHQDFCLLNESVDKLSILYLKEMVRYSILFDEKKSKNEKEKIRRDLTLLIEEWEETIKSREDFENEYL